MRYPDWEIVVEEKDNGNMQDLQLTGSHDRPMPSQEEQVMFDAAISDEMSEEEPGINVLEENAL